MIGNKTMKLAWAIAWLMVAAMASSASAAVNRIVCVPWMGNPDSPHTTINTVPVNLYAVIYGDATGGTVSYSWDFMDGTAPAVGSISIPANGIANLQVAHTFSGGLYSPFATKLTIESKSDIYNIMIQPNNDDSKVNMAIDRALWYLHGQMIRSNIGSPSVPGGYWNDWSWFVGRTGGCVLAFEVQGHRLNIEADPLAPVEDPYVEDVQRGINYLLSRTYNVAMTAQTHGHPEDYNGDGVAEGNGFGLVSYYDGGSTNYEQGLAMGAIAGSGKPEAAATIGLATYVMGRTYKAIVQDMVDWYSFSQLDDPTFPPSGGRGGWYYYAADNGNWGAGAGDNSASQWAYIGLDAAETNVGALIPAWVKRQMAGYLHGQLARNGGFVSYRSNETYPNIVLTGGALVGLATIGSTIYDSVNGAGAYATDLTNTKTAIGNRWLGTEWRYQENWYGHRAYYTMYACMKGFRLHGISELPGTPGTSDWYADYVSVIVPDQQADGHWRGTGWMDSYIVEDLGTAFGVLILTPSVFSPPPVACFSVEPNPSYIDIPVIFDPSCTYHSDKTRKIVSYEWDWDNDGVYDISSATAQIQTHSWSALGVYPVKLRVTDDATPTATTDTYVVEVHVSIPPHPPIANAGGPYMASLCVGDSLKLDGSDSFDIDEGGSETGNPPLDTITSWNWDLDGGSWTYANASGKTATVNPATYFGVGAYTIGVKVADNTALAYPGSGKPNLTDDAFATVNVTAGCACDLAARPKSGKVQLTWTHTGAASYDIYRSTKGPNTGFVLIANNFVTTYATYLDLKVINGTKYYYRIISSDGCGSKAVNATPPIPRR